VSYIYLKRPNNIAGDIMSWKYRLLGKPQTVEEFADKSKRTKETVQVVVRKCPVAAIAMADDREYTAFRYGVELRAGRDTRIVDTRCYGDSIGGTSPQVMRDARTAMVDRATEISEFLRSKGIQIVLRDELRSGLQAQA
jgi:hypothetical protein